jgi:hypothetical protein
MAAVQQSEMYVHSFEQVAAFTGVAESGQDTSRVRAAERVAFVSRLPCRALDQFPLIPCAFIMMPLVSSHPKSSVHTRIELVKPYASLKSKQCCLGQGIAGPECRAANYRVKLLKGPINTDYSCCN